MYSVLQEHIPIVLALKELKNTIQIGKVSSIIAQNMDLQYVTMQKR